MERIRTLDSIRGLAASAVVLFHFTNSNVSFLNEGALRNFGKFGFLGVVMFFIISGFVLCNTLIHIEYKFKYFPYFILKRLIRLEPPYLLSILIVVFLNFVSEKSSIYQGVHHNYTYLGILSHVGYLSDLFGIRWLNPVYWTLGIEFQFYLLLGLIFPFLKFSSKSFLLVFILCLFSCLIINSDVFIFKYLPYFLIGVIFCFHFNKLMSKTETFGYFFISLIYIFFLGEGTCQVIASLITVILIFWSPFGEVIFLKFLGKISYSLYLIHIPIGLRIINYGARFSHDNYFMQIIILILAIVICLISSFVLYHFVERPTIAFSKNIKLYN